MSTRMAFTIPDDLARAARVAAARADMNLSDVVVRALESFAAAEGVAPPRIRWPTLVDSSTSVAASAKAIEDGRP